MIRIAEKYFGPVCKEGLPSSGSEDFGFYLQHKPGCFYFLGINQEGKDYYLHTSNYDYNDSMIAGGAYMFLRIIEDRLQV